MSPFGSHLEEILLLVRARDEATDVMNRVGKQLDQTHQAMLALGGALTTIGVAGAAGFGAALHAAADFERQMSAVKAVMAPDDIREFGSALEALALQLGKETSFSAREAAEGIEELVKAGVSAADILSGAGAAALDLAAAGGIKVAEAAEIASNAMNSFNLRGEDMAHVADVIAGAANASAISVTEFRFSLAQVGAMANLTGQSFEDTATAIALMGNAGIKGSDAGTSLKTMLANLIPETNKQIAAFRQLGLLTFDTARAMEVLAEQGIDATSASMAELGDLLVRHVGGIEDWNTATDKQRQNYDTLLRQLGVSKNAFLDEIGNFKSLRDIAALLNEGIQGLSESQREQALSAIFGSDAIRAATVLAQAGGEGFDKLAESIGKVTAQQVAAERLNNLHGALEALKGSAETLAITIGQQLLPAATALARGATDLLNRFLDLPEPVQNTAIALGAVATAVGLLGGPLLLLIGQLPAIAAGLAVVLPLLAGLAAPLLAAVAAVGLLTAAFVNDWGGIRTNVLAVWQSVQPVLEALGEALGELAGTVAGFLRTWLGGWAQAEEAVAEAGDGIWPVTRQLTRVLQNDLAPAIRAFARLWRETWDVVAPVVGAALGFVGNRLDVTLATIAQFIVAMRRFAADFAAAWDSTSAAVGAFFDGVGTTLQGVLGTVGGFFDALGTAVQDGLLGASGALAAFGQFWADVLDGFTRWREDTLGFWRRFFDVFGREVHEALLNRDTGVLGPWVRLLDDVTAAVGAWWDDTLGAWGAFFGRLADAWSGALSAVTDLVGGWVQDRLAAFGAFFGELGSLAQEGLRGGAGLVGQWADALGAVAQAVSDWATDRLNTLSQFFTDLLNTAGEHLFGGGGLVATFGDGLGQIATLIADLFAPAGQAVSGFMEGLANLGAAAWGRLVSDADSLLVTFLDAGAELVSRVAEIGANILGGLLHGFEQAVANNPLVDFFRRVLVQPAVTAANAALQAESPAKVFLPVGASIADGIFEGLRIRLGQLGDLFKGAITQTVEGLVPVAIQSTEELLKQLYTQGLAAANATLSAIGQQVIAGGGAAYLPGGLQGLGATIAALGGQKPTGSGSEPTNLGVTPFGGVNVSGQGIAALMQALAGVGGSTEPGKSWATQGGVPPSGITAFWSAIAQQQFPITNQTGGIAFSPGQIAWSPTAFVGGQPLSAGPTPWVPAQVPTWMGGPGLGIPGFLAHQQAQEAARIEQLRQAIIAVGGLQSTVEGLQAWIEELLSLGGSLVGLQHGGIVTGPTAAVVGEGAHPELITPLPPGGAPVQVQGFAESAMRQWFEQFVPADLDLNERLQAAIRQMERTLAVAIGETTRATRDLLPLVVPFSGASSALAALAASNAEVRDALTSPASLATVAAAVHAAKTALQGAVDSARTTLDATLGTVRSAVDSARTTLEAALTALQGTPAATLAALNTTLSTTVTNAITGLRGAENATLTTLSDALDVLAGGSASLVTALGTGGPGNNVLAGLSTITTNQGALLSAVNATTSAVNTVNTRLSNLATALVGTGATGTQGSIIARLLEIRALLGPSGEGLAPAVYELDRVVAARDQDWHLHGPNPEPGYGGATGAYGVTPPYTSKLALGGLFATPTLALIGEAGPEAVLPLRYLDLLAARTARVAALVARAALPAGDHPFPAEAGRPARGAPLIAGDFTFIQQQPTVRLGPEDVDTVLWRLDHLYRERG